MTTALFRRARSRSEASELLQRAETARQMLVRELGEQADVTSEWDRFMSMWVHRNSIFLSVATKERWLLRARRATGLDPQRQLFGLGELSGISSFTGIHRRQPPGLTDPMSRDRRLRPITELTLRDDLPAGLTLSGLKPQDSLLVHMGSVAYDGALVILSMTVPISDPIWPEGVRLVTARILATEAPECSYKNGYAIRIRVSDGEPDGLLIEPGGAHVECVIFNRPDVLAALPEN